jgi:prepilin-type N-terminal cleavage/methylation domain-containing protein
MFNRRGFTLLEVLLVVSLLAMIAGFSVASYRNYGKTVEIDAVAKNIIYDLRQARSRAAAGEDRRNWGAHFANGAQDYYELFSTPTNYLDVSKTVISAIYLPATVHFITPAESANLDLIFSSIAGETTADFLTINSEDNTRTINVTASGAIY